MAKTKYPDVFPTTSDTIDTLPPLLKKVAFELMRIGKIRIVDGPPENPTPAEQERKSRK